MIDPHMSDEEKQHLKWLLIGAIVASGVAAVCDIVKTEITGWLQRRRGAVDENYVDEKSSVRLRTRK